jgi:hypothetical protein
MRRPAGSARNDSLNRCHDEAAIASREPRRGWPSQITRSFFPAHSSACGKQCVGRKAFPDIIGERGPLLSTLCRSTPSLTLLAVYRQILGLSFPESGQPWRRRKGPAARRADVFSPRDRGRKQSFFPILRMPAIAQVDNARCFHFGELAP